MQKKYFLTLENTKQFNAHKFDEERLSSAAETSWYALNTYARTDYVNMFTRTNVEMNDQWFALGGYFADQERGFYSEAKPTRAMPYK